MAFPHANAWPKDAAPLTFTAVERRGRTKLAQGFSSRKKFEPLLPRIFPGLAVLRRYDGSWLPLDLIAGLSVATIALPVGIAYADLAGVPPIIGIYSSIFPLLAYALLGSSRQLIIGPDAATCLVVATCLTPLGRGDPQLYLSLMPILTVMTGAIYLIAGLARFGFIVNFFSQPILIGYMNGVALIIIVGQISKILGYPGQARDFLAQLQEVASSFGNMNWATVCLSISAITALLTLRRLAPRLSGPFLVVTGSIAAVAMFDLKAVGVAVIGALPVSPPTWLPPALDAPTCLELLQDGAAIMLISFASGMLTAKSFARRNGQELDANQELIAFGISNLASGFLQGFAVSGADSRTAVNNAAGGKSPLAGIVAAGAMALALFFAQDLLALVPTAVLASVVFVSALGLFDIGASIELMRISWREGLLSILTTVGVLILGVLPGIVLVIGVSLAWLLVLTSRPVVSRLGLVPGIDGYHSIADYGEARTIPGVLIFRFEAPLFGFNIDHFASSLRKAIKSSRDPVSWIIIDGSPVNLLDVTAAHYLKELRAELEGQGITLCFAKTKRSAARLFDQAWVSNWLETSGILLFPTITAALRAFRQAPGWRSVDGEVTTPLPPPND